MRGIATLDPDKARLAVFGRIHPTEPERAGAVNALGRVLAEAVVADCDVPPWATAVRDGFAARSADTRGATEKIPRMLSVLAEHATSNTQLVPGTCVPVRAGDPLPVGADTVVGASHSYRPTNDPQVAVLAESQPGEHVRPAGHVVTKNEIVVPEGTLITSREMGLIASLGVESVRVRCKPKVALLTTGTDAPGSARMAGTGLLTNSVQHYLIGAILESGCELGTVKHVHDGRAGLEKTLDRLNGSDAILIALGPWGSHDATIAAVRNTGELLVERLSAQPGAATGFGVVRDKAVFVVPAESVLEAFEVLIRPALLTMLGRSSVDRPRVLSRSLSVLRLNPGCRHYVKAITTYGEDGYSSRPIQSAASGVRAWTPPNSLLIVPENNEGVRRGDILEAMLLQ